MCQVLTTAKQLKTKAGVKVGLLALLITLPSSSFLLPDHLLPLSLSLVPSLNCTPSIWAQTLPCVIRILSVRFLANAYAQDSPQPCDSFAVLVISE